MQADLSKRLARLRDFPVGFDAPNTLVLWLIGEELRTRTLAHIGQLSPTVKVQLRAVYSALAHTLPGDPTSPRLLAALDQSQGLPASHIVPTLRGIPSLAPSRNR